MAKGTRELRRRIRGVKNIAQITRAMEMVASTKLKRLQERADGSKPYRQSLQGVVARLADKVSPEEYPLLRKPAGDAAKAPIGILAVTADKGLCGAYNSNMFRAVQAFAKQQGKGVKLFVLGSRGRSFFARNEPKMVEGFEDGLEKIPFTRVRDIVRSVVRRFLTGELSELHLVSTRFLSAAQQKPDSIQLLPIDAAKLGDKNAGKAAKSAEPLLEPSPGEIFSRLLPKYLEVQVYGAVLEALASEFAMRRAAMKAATDAAKDMIGSLTRQYNRARQETITKELLEIVGGAEALKG
jgi:F-type H+-transporting ATPase subunit gamma